MGDYPAELPAEDRVRLTAEFASPELEAAYRRRHASQDQFFARVIIALAAVTVAALGALDYQLIAPGPQLACLSGARAAFLALSAAALVALRRGSGPAAFERVFGAWYVLAVALHVYVGAVWPAGHVEMRMTAAIAVLMSYCVMPVPLRLQAAGALLHTAGSLAVSGWLNPSGDGAALTGELCWLALINAVGLFLSHRLQSRQRLLFAALLRQSELSAGLGRALAEVRTLRGLIRVCAWCRKVDAGTAWQQLEAYVRDHSHAEFTHGICPICLAAATAGTIGTGV